MSHNGSKKMTKKRTKKSWPKEPVASRGDLLVLGLAQHRVDSPLSCCPFRLDPIDLIAWFSEFWGQAGPRFPAGVPNRLAIGVGLAKG